MAIFHQSIYPGLTGSHLLQSAKRSLSVTGVGPSAAVSVVWPEEAVIIAGLLLSLVGSWDLCEIDEIGWLNFVLCE